MTTTVFSGAEPQLSVAPIESGSETPMIVGNPALMRGLQRRRRPAWTVAVPLAALALAAAGVAFILTHHTTVALNTSLAAASPTLPAVNLTPVYPVAPTLAVTPVAPTVAAPHRRLAMNTARAARPFAVHKRSPARAPSAADMAADVSAQAPIASASAPAAVVAAPPESPAISAAPPSPRPPAATPEATLAPAAPAFPAPLNNPPQP